MSFHRLRRGRWGPRIQQSCQVWPSWFCLCFSIAGPSGLRGHARAPAPCAPSSAPRANSRLNTALESARSDWYTYPMKASAVAKQALHLPIKERAKLAQRLLESLDDLSEAEAEKLWVAEADRRAKQLKEGKVRPVSAEELERRVQARLK